MSAKPTARQLVSHLTEADYDIDKATKFRCSTKELAKQTAPETPLTRFQDLYAEFDEPVALIAFDTRNELTGPIGYSARAENLLSAVQWLHAKCDGRLKDFGRPASGMNSQSWFKFSTKRGLVTFIGRNDKAAAVVSRFEDADLDSKQVNSLFMFFFQTSQNDTLALFTDPDVEKTKDVKLAKFARLTRRNVRAEVLR